MVGRLVQGDPAGRLFFFLLETNRWFCYPPPPVRHPPSMGLLPPPAFNEAITSASISLSGTSYTLVAIYAPVAAHAHLSLLDSLLSFSFPADGPLILGGDFNCVEVSERDYRGLYPNYHQQKPGGDKLAGLFAQRLHVDGRTSFFGSGCPTPFTRYTRTAHSDEASHIERIYLDATLVSGITAPLTDHEAVELELCLGSVTPSVSH